jgi:hypothetical protein
MNTLNLGIVMNQGDDFQVIIQVNSPCTPGNPSTPIDITGYQFKGQMRATTVAGGPVVAEFTFAIQNQTTNKGQVLWSLPNVTTTALFASIANAEEPNRLTTPYMFDVKMMDTSSVVSRIVQGIMKLSPQVTMETV